MVSSCRKIGRRYAFFMQSLDSLAEPASDDGREQDTTGTEQPFSGASASPPPPSPSFQYDTEDVPEGIDEGVDVSGGRDGGVGDLFEEEEGHLYEAQGRLSTALRQAQERSVLLSSSLANVGDRGRAEGRVMHGAAGRGDAATEAAAAQQEAALAAAGAEVSAVQSIRIRRFAPHLVEVILLIWVWRCRCCRACPRSFYVP